MVTYRSPGLLDEKFVNKRIYFSPIGRLPINNNKKGITSARDSERILFVLKTLFYTENLNKANGFI